VQNRLQSWGYVKGSDRSEGVRQTRSQHERKHSVARSSKGPALLPTLRERKDHRRSIRDAEQKKMNGVGNGVQSSDTPTRQETPAKVKSNAERLGRPSKRSSYGNGGQLAELD